MFYKDRNVLVTGGGGMIGQWLVRKLLDQGAYVRATEYRRRKIAMTHKNLEVIQCDLRNEEEARSVFKNMDIAFLAAAWVGAAKSVREDPSALIMYNVELQSKMIHWAAKMKLQRCGFVSSSYVYPDTGKPNVENEGFQGNPWIPMIYGLGWFKRYLETLCKHFHMTSATDYAIIRPATSYGPYDNFNPDESHAIPALIVRAVSRMDPYEVWGNGEDVRSFIYVEDLVEGFLLTVEKYPVAEALNICAGQAYTIKDVVRILLDYLEFRPRVVFNTTKPSVIPYKVSDPSKAKELIRWETKVGLQEGLKQTVDWYIEHRESAAPKSRSEDSLGRKTGGAHVL